MNTQEVENLTQKVKDGLATQEEQLALIKHLNKGVDEMRDIIREVNTETK
jgi:hypothetical protein